MGRGQVVRRLALDEEIVGSTPTVPANLDSAFSGALNFLGLARSWFIGRLGNYNRSMLWFII